MNSERFLKTLWLVWQLGSGFCVAVCIVDLFSRKGSMSLLKQAKRERIECEELLKKCETTLASNKQLLQKKEKWVS